MLAIVKEFIKSEISRLLWKWPIFPGVAMAISILYYFGLVDMNTQVPQYVEFAFYLLFNIDKANLLFVLIFPFLFLMWGVTRYADLPALEHSFIVKASLFAIDRVVDVVRILSGGYFGLWIFSFIPELEVGSSIAMLKDSACFLILSVILSGSGRYYIGWFFENKK